MSALLTVLLHFSAIIVILCASEPEVLNDISIKILTDSDSPCPPTEQCLTLEQFRRNASQYSRSNISLTLEFLPGDHRLTAPVTFNAVSNLTLLSRTENANIICFNKSNHTVHFTFKNIMIGELTRLTFLECGLNDHYAAFKIINSSNLTIKECMILDSKGVALKAEFSNITMYKSTFSNSSSNHQGDILHISKSDLSIAECKFHNSEGTIVKADHSNIMIYKSEFTDSLTHVLDIDGGQVSDVGSLYYNNCPAYAVVKSNSSVLNFRSCRFYTNYGRLFLAINTILVLNLSEVANNIARYFIFLIQYSDSTIRIENSYIKENEARLGILQFLYSCILLKNVTIFKNIVSIGEVLSIIESTLQLESNDNNVILIAANRGKNGVIDLQESEVNITGKVMYFNNFGTFLIINSRVRFFNDTIFKNCKGSITRSSTSRLFPEGGAINFVGSKIWFYDSVTFVNNTRINVGGGFRAIRSEVYILESIQVSKNQAKHRGSGIYLYKSSFICMKQCNISENGMNSKSSRGGGIYAFDSKIVLGSTGEPNNVSFVMKSNIATVGGGIYFEANSRLQIPKGVQYTLIFEQNHAIANEGKAIYIDDNTYLDTCEEYMPCFLQVALQQQQPRNYEQNSIQIVGNATETKYSIFGGLLNKCFTNDEFNYYDYSFTTGIEYLETVMTNISGLITSNAVHIQFFQMESTLSLKKSVKKGEEFTVKVCALDQVDNKVGANISSSLINKHTISYLKQDQYFQNVSAECSNLTFNVYSLKNTEVLSINLEGHCKGGSNSDALLVNINFTECTCPVGFYAFNQLRVPECRCECDPKILSLQIECNSSTVIKRSRYWIAYDNCTGFLLHPFCPYDFCYPPDTVISIDLEFPKGSDAQCNFNHSGLLCGQCKSGYSLSLSSSRCVQCPEINWPWALLIVTVNLIAGFVLVILILVLNLSVSIGTLNGLIFYANILAADTSLFLSFSKPNFQTIFVAWLNLDLGFDVCYFKGMDAYSKAWLNISFPIYVIFVLILIILISKYSSRFGNFIGRWNPVSTLATLLLLSYTKLLRVIITALSFTTVTYPTGKQKLVWLQDASVKYFGLKHFPLSLVAIAIIFVGFVYTILLFFWQWILRLPNRRIFKWARNTRLNLFIEANLAPYKAKYRYWFGLLLLVRMALYLGIATEKSRESVTVVLAIGLIAASILLLRTFLGNNVYRNRSIGYINSSFFYNLLALSLARLYCLNSSPCRKRSSIISIGLAFILFVIILSYHILNILLEINCFRYLIASIEQILHLRRLKIRLIDDPRFKNAQESELQEAGITEPTFTEVILSPTKRSKGANEISGSADEENRHRMENEETVMNDSCSGVGDDDHVCKQKTHQKGKRWTDSNRLREPLLSLQD